MNSINFVPKSVDAEACVERPVRASAAMPEWFKKMPPSIDGHGSGKACPPFVDSFILGYIQKLWCDVEFSGDGKYVSFDSDFDPVTVKKINPKHVPIFEGYESVELQWNTHWEPVTPEGYSTLYLHPLNQYDLPFTTFSGMIETDKFSLTGPLRFLLKKGFNGVIKKGTPLYQMIPIKRESWDSEKYEYNHDMLNYQNNLINQYKHRGKHDGYKKIFWQKKKYN